MDYEPRKPLTHFDCENLTRPFMTCCFSNSTLITICLISHQNDTTIINCWHTISFALYGIVLAEK